MNSLFISKYCHIKNNKIVVDGKTVYTDDESTDLAAFAKKAYRHLKPSYNKFFKMDEISKLGFLAAEVLLSDIDVAEYQPEDIAIIISNSHSTLTTDINHQHTIKDTDSFFPSPKIFVYTLPNIMIGEISIRHKLRGENTFFIVENFNAELLVNHINSLFLTHKSNAFVGGWVNQNKNDYEAFLFLASNEKGVHFNALEMNKLYRLID